MAGDPRHSVCFTIGSGDKIGDVCRPIPVHNCGNLEWQIAHGWVGWTVVIETIGILKHPHHESQMASGGVPGYDDAAGIEMKMFGIAIDPTQSTTRIFNSRRRQCRSGHAIVDIDRLSALPPPHNSRRDCIPVGQITAHLIVDIPYFGHSFVLFDDKRNMYDMITT